MSHRTVCQLPTETTRLIASTQIITSVSTAVKELVENSLDAGASSIQVKLENYGLNSIEVKDDGSGISYDNVQRMFLPGYTSKIREFKDLGDLQSYGFRGEALGALCKLGKIVMTTKTQNDTLAMTYTISSDGIPQSSKPSHLNKGTIIAISNLFNSLPVRKQYLSSKKRVSEELKKVEQVIQSLCVVHPELRMSLIHNKSNIWQKNSVRGLKQSFMQIVGLKTASKLDYLNETTNEMVVDLVVPRKNLEDTEHIFTNLSHHVFIHINKRPVFCKEISKVVMEHIFNHYSRIETSNKYAICLISLCVSPSQIDVNLEPNKTRALLKNQSEVLSLIDDVLSTYYGHKISRPVDPLAQTEQMEDEDEDNDQEIKRPRLEDEELVLSARNEEFRKKNKDWRLEFVNKEKHSINIIDLDTVEGPNNVSSATGLCSQINVNNCILTEKEKTQVNEFLNETNASVSTITNYNSDVRLKVRDEIPSKAAVQVELPPWPSRSPIKKPSEAKAVEEIVKEIEIDVEKWSKGIVELENGNKLQSGAVLLQPEVIEESRISKGDLDQFDLSMQSISSQMGKKELSAFTKFARIMRPRIIAEFPNIVFTKVAGLLVERWQSLPQDEKNHYEKMAKVVDAERKAHQESKKIANETEKTEKVTALPKNNIKAMFSKMKEKQRPPRREIVITASLSEVLRLRGLSVNGEDDTIELIGQLRPSGNWLYRKQKEIGHLRHVGLQELVISQKMLSSYSIPRKDVERPIYINEDNLGSELWAVLLTLDTEYDQVSCRHVVSSDVVLKNGFQVEMEKCSEAVHSALITQVASSIPQYGVADLRDALKLYEVNGEFAGLLKWRPVAVCNYITNEAIRISQQTMRTPDRQELQDLLETWQMCLKHLPPQCLHCKDIFVPFYHLEDTKVSRAEFSTVQDILASLQ